MSELEEAAIEYVQAYNDWIDCELSHGGYQLAFDKLRKLVENLDVGEH